MSIFQEQPVRDKQMKFVVSEQERAAMQELADAMEISVAELMRRAVNEFARTHASALKERRRKR